MEEDEAKTTFKYKLNVGCGTLPISSYVNIDIRQLDGVDIVCDVRKLEMFDDNSVDELFAKDVIEHIPRREWQNVLNEWIRVIKPGGLLKIRFPDMLKLFEAYKIGQFNPNKVYGTDKYNEHDISVWSVSRLGQLLFGDQDVPENAHLSGLTEFIVVDHLKSMGMNIIKVFYDGYADTRITASKGEVDLSLNLDHPDYNL